MKDWITDFKNSLNEMTTSGTVSANYRKLILWGIVILIFIVRLLTIQTPALDRTFWKEIDYICISKNYLANGFNFFQPTISWPAEPPNVTAMEFPLIPYLAALLYNIFGYHILTVRILTLLFFLIVVYYTYRLTSKYFGPIAGLTAALLSGILPLNSPFGNILFSEPAMIASSVFTIFYFSEWMDKDKKRDLFLAIAGLSLAVALKLEPLYLLLPITWLFLKKYGFNIKKYYILISFVIVSLILPVCWYSYAYYLTTHSIDVFGIFKGHDKLQTLTMLSNPIWYMKMRWSLSSLLGKWVGLFLILAGVASAFMIRKGSLLYFYLAAIIIFFIIVAEGNIDAPYRQLCIIPPAASFMALGSLSILAFIKVLSDRVFNSNLRISSNLALWLAFAIILIIPIHNSKFLFNKNPENPAYPDQWGFAQKIKHFANPSSKIITTGTYSMHMGGNDLSPVLYYYSGLKGWTLQSKDWNLKNVERLENKGAELFVACQISREPEMKKFIDLLKQRYPVLFEEKETDFILLSLKNKPYTKSGYASKNGKQD